MNMKEIQLMEKYNIDESEIENDIIKQYEFYYHSELEKTLLHQIIYNIVGSKARIYYYVHRGKRIRSYVDCTYEQFIEISVRYDFYKLLMQEELDVFIRAFIYKHKIFPTYSNEEEELDISELSEEELNKIVRAGLMMRSLKDESYQEHKLIETR